MSDQGINLQVIEGFLREQKAEPELIEHILQVIKQRKHKTRNQRGTKLILIGVLILGIAFISSVYLHATGSYNLDFPLYGLTGAGAIILLAGLVLIFS